MAAAPSTPTTNLQRLEALEERVRTQNERIAKLERVIAGMAAVFGGGVGGDAAPEAASDRELDQQHGDPEVKVIPRDAAGMGVVKGQKLSRCPVDFLEVYAEAHDWFAQKNDERGEMDARGKPKSAWDRKAARLARGWARRIREGWTPPAPPPTPTFGGNSGGFGTSTGFGSGTGFGSSNGSRGFLGGAPPASPPAPPSSTPDAGTFDGTDFDFGANVGKAPATTPATEDDDDDPPM